MDRQGVFTKELEEALLDDRCDLAVHSMKDLPVRFPSGLGLGAVLEREDPREAFITKDRCTLSELPKGAVLGTSSLRRRSQILQLRPDLKPQDLRGNLPTRIRSVGLPLEDGEAPPQKQCDATILARAGLLRLGLDHLVGQVLEVDEVLPAPAQGAVAVEIRADDPTTAGHLRPLDHPETRRLVTAEREFLEALGGWCHVPIGALATPTQGGLRLRGFVGSADGSQVLRDEVTESDPITAGRTLAERLERVGALRILRDVLKATQPPPQDPPQ